MPSRVTASIRPLALDEVIEALADVGVFEVTVIAAKGFSGRPQRLKYRGSEYLALDERVLVMVMVGDERAHLVADLIAANARTPVPGDGSISIERIEAAIDIHGS